MFVENLYKNIKGNSSKGQQFYYFKTRTKILPFRIPKI